MFTRTSGHLKGYSNISLTQLLGLSNLVREANNSEVELKKITCYMEQSFLALDDFTKELTTFIHNSKLKGLE